MSVGIRHHKNRFTITGGVGDVILFQTVLLSLPNIKDFWRATFFSEILQSFL